MGPDGLLDGGTFTEEKLEELGKHIRSPIAGTLAMIEAYETKLGILNHDSEEAKRDSLALVRMNEAEEPARYSPFERRVWDYTEKEIQKHFGLSLFEFLEQPRHVVEMLISVAERMQKDEYIVNRNKLDELNKSLN